MPTNDQRNGRDKAAIVVLSDPDGSDDALGRIVNALGTAAELKQSGAEVDVIFSGAGTRWLGALSAKGHPAHGLYEAISDRVVGASAFCAGAFGAAKEVEHADAAMLSQNPATGQDGLPSLLAYVRDGTPVLTF